MRLQLVCAGRLKIGPERDLAARYVERANAAGRAAGFSAVELRETAESRAARPAGRKREEAKAFFGLLTEGKQVFALDESGEQMTSRAFAATLGRMRDAGASSAALVIGGPDGLDPDFLAAATVKLSFGAMTWPHQLMRILAAEQIYRAITILAGHPYHRG